MKNINITRDEAINKIINHIHRGDLIPIVSLGNGGVGFDWIGSTNVSPEALVAELKDTDNYNFRVVPVADIAEDFYGNVHFENYDVCVEFASTSGDNPYREQYLLWFD